MKKLVLTFTIVLGLATGAMAQSLFQKSAREQSNGPTRDGVTLPMLPGSHNTTEDAEADPLTDGVLLLAGLGAAYLFGKKKKD